MLNAKFPLKEYLLKSSPNKNKKSFSLYRSRCHIHFWDDVWCNDVPLRASFPMLYRIVQRKDAILVDVLGGQNEFIHWDIHFTHSIQDWKLESLQSFFALLNSTNIDQNGIDKMVWKPAMNGSFKVKILL